MERRYNPIGRDVPKLTDAGLRMCPAKRALLVIQTTALGRAEACRIRIVRAAPH
ncbi:hypothetical protein M408DRAFT_255662 [Serendipita vermifera MAFF 305830]|uniref:Uncharacterized protein n=1 Tax=Serendipita vermifera MAFF 305830 TaxID=933852 RepID=A0A0C3BGE1_SERVB|nr:hypothetical protein M408DRAFT_255662 [Serendipita vermifera MAFF 305830]